MYRRTLKVKRDRVHRQHLRELRAREQERKSAATTQAAGAKE
jgi:hypothetical protein